MAKHAPIKDGSLHGSVGYPKAEDEGEQGAAAAQMPLSTLLHGLKSFSGCGWMKRGEWWKSSTPTVRSSSGALRPR